MRFGRMGRRLDEVRGAHYTRAVEELTGKELPGDLRSLIGHGADEIDLVRSGLEDTMRLALQAILDRYRSDDGIEDLRTAAYVIAIEKIARSYLDVGIS
jgi:glutamate dehydrogenase (NAD(P)+)